MQNEIIKKERLLDEFGRVANPGFAKKHLFEYHRKDIKASFLKIKEWDYYLITNDDYGIAFTVADNSYLGFISVTLLDFKKRSYEMFSQMKFFTFGRFNMPSSTESGDVHFEDKKIKIDYVIKEGKRLLDCDIRDFKNGVPLTAHIVLNKIPEESMVIATPFKENKKAFYYNQKINCMNANGVVKYGSQEIHFKDDDGVLDWGRGVWTYDNTWFWATASHHINGVPFGLNFGYGFGDTSKATENMLFYDGKAHKLDQVTFGIPKKEDGYDFLKEWSVTSNDDRVNLTFSPILDRKDRAKVLFILSDQHQVFGHFNGTVVLDDGTLLEIKSLLGSAEVVHNKW
jgi:hypothetical protein